MAGETNIGGIVGWLRLDADQFNRAIDEAILKTEILDGKRVDVQLNADEVRKLPQDAQRATSSIDSMAQGQRRLEDATRRVELAQLKVIEANDSGKASRIYAAQTELTKARRAESDAIYATYDANLKASAGADKLAESNERAEKSIRKVGDSSKDSKSHVGALATAIITLGPALVPLAAGAVGLGAAFGGMGAAGVLAVVGIKREMAAGTKVGLEYTASITELKGEFNSLATVAAKNVLAPFQSVVADLQARTPALTGMVGEFSTIVGKAGANVAGGLVAAFVQLEPLMRDASVYVLDLTSRFREMMSGPGVVSFGDYVRSVFPQVMQAVESIVGAAIRLVAALAPLGLGTLSVLRTLADVINAIPVDVLATLATTASSVFFGFKTWQGLSALVGGLSTVMENLGVKATIATVAVRGLQAAAGIVGVAIAALSWIVSANAEKQREAESAANDYADALRRTNGVVDESIRTMTAKRLADEGATKIAREMGIELPRLTDAALGNAAAIAYVNSKIDEYKTNTAGANDGTRTAAQASIIRVQAGEKLAAQLGIENKGLSDGAQKNLDAAAAAKASSGAISEQTIALQNQASVYRTSVTTYQAAVQHQKDIATQAQAATVQMQLENDAAGLLKASLDKLNGEAINAAQAQNAFDSSLANMGDHTTATGKKIHFTTTSIKDMSAASVALRGQLIGQVQNLQNVVEANGGLADSTGKAQEQMKAMRQKIIDNAVAHGVDRKAVTDYIDGLLKIPKTVPPTKLDVDKAAATQKVKEFVGVINGIPTYREVFISVGTNAGAAVASVASAFNSIGSSLFPKKRAATGALTLPNGVRAMAAGDVVGRPSMIMRSMKPILWNEAPGGEAYISLAPQQRQRSQAIWQETGALLGMGGGSRGGFDDASIASFERMFERVLRRLPTPVTRIDELSKGLV